MTESLVNAGGTKPTATFAPVSPIASATLPNTGSEALSKSTLVPALRALTPPTTLAPEASMRRVCFMPSEPVIPCTMIRLFSSRKIATATSLPSVCEFGGLVGRVVHGVDQRDQRVRGLAEDAASLDDVVAVEPDDQWLVRFVPEHAERRDDAVRHRVAGGDAAEDVDEDRPDGGGVEDDVQTVGHDLPAGATPDVEEVRRLHAAVLLAGVRDDVQRRHDQAGAVPDHADLAVELDVVEALLLRLLLQRVGRLRVEELLVLGLPEVGVVVEGHLAVERDDPAVAEAGQRVHLDQGGVLLDERLPQRHEDVRDLVDEFGRELRGGGDLARLGAVHALDRVHRHPGQRIRTLGRQLLDLHAALVGRHREERSVRAVEEEGDVVLLLDVGPRVDENAVHRVPLDVHAEDLLGVRARVVRRPGHLHTAGLAAAADLDLRLDDGHAADLRGDRPGIVRGRRHLAEADRHAVVLEQLLGLELEQIHAGMSVLLCGTNPWTLARDPGLPPRAETGFTGPGCLFRGDVCANPGDDLVHRRAGSEHLGHAGLPELGNVLVRDDAAAEQDDVVGFVLVQQLDHALEERHVRAGEDGEPHGVGVLLHDGLDDLLGRLVQAGVDDLHAGVAEGPGDDLGPAVVPVEARFGDDDADALAHLRSVSAARGADTARR